MPPRLPIRVHEVNGVVVTVVVGRSGRVLPRLWVGSGPASKSGTIVPRPEVNQFNVIGASEVLILLSCIMPPVMTYLIRSRILFYLRSVWKIIVYLYRRTIIRTNDRKITSSLSYLVHTLRNAFSHRNSLSIIFLRLYSSWSYSHGFMRFFFGGTTGLCPKDWQSSLVLSPS